MMTHPTNLGAITERRIERVLTREGCMELALQQIIMKCDGSNMQTKRIRNIRKRATAGLDGRDPSSPGELGHVPPNHLLMAQLELSGKETEAARAERDALAAELKALQDSIKPIHVDFDDALNDAGWRFIEYFNNDIPVHVFNWCKPALKLCIEAWLDRRGLSVHRPPPDHAIATAGAPS